MNKLQKKQLRESIMRNVRKNLVLNENFNHDTYECIMTVDGPCKMAIGDPCYVLSENNYERLIIDQEEGLMADGMGMFHSTYSGDGEYNSMSNFLYGVDAGILGICRCTDTDQDCEGLVKFIDIKPGRHTVNMVYDDGTFTFLVDRQIVEEIYTGYDDEEDYIEDDNYGDEDFGYRYED